jgi:hypothetical protein
MNERVPLFAVVFLAVFTLLPLLGAAFPKVRQGWRWGRRRRNGAPISTYGALAWAGIGVSLCLVTTLFRLRPDTGPWPMAIVALAFANFVFAAYRDNRQHYRTK